MSAESEMAPGNAPAATVIVPTYNRPARLSRCLEGLARQDAGRAVFEVMVVDDGGADPLDAVVEPFRAQLDVRLLRQANAGPAAARNAGAAAARGQLLAFTDDDCIPAPDWLTQLMRTHERFPTGLIGGATVNALSSNMLSEASQELVSYLYAYNDATSGQPAFFTSNNMALARDAFLAGPFDTSFRLAAGEDREFCDRWLATGRTMHFAPEAVIMHYHELSSRSYWRQHFNYGRGAFHFHAARARRSGGVKMEPLSFYTGLVLFPFRSRRPLLQRAAVSFWLGVSQAANAAGYFYERRLASPSDRRAAPGRGE
jgi:glycosyltransferase involved in cell wall biosynthesis